MLDRGILTSIIGFLVGCLLYYVADASVVVVLVMGSAGYFLGLMLDNADIKRQLETFHFSTIPPTQEIFQSDDLSATIFYSSKDNLTTVSIDFQVETKPQTFRLSVLKNLQEHQFRILENSSKTIFSLTLDFPECHYPKLLSSPDQKKEFHYDIQERSLDFQNAIQKIVPGLVLSKPSYLSLFGEETIHLDSSSPRSSQFPPPSSPSNSFIQPLNGSDIKRSRPIDALSLIESEKSQEINESQIMDDLFSSSSVKPNVPDLSPEETQHLKDSNQRQLEVFLNETDEESSDETTAGKLVGTDDLEIDYSNVNQPDTISPEDFNQSIISKLEERTEIAINKVASDLELQKERDKVKKYFDGEAATEESIS